jgi:hypothetical protein
MPNANKPTGLSPVQYLSGAPWSGQARVYYIASTDTNAFAIGDPVASSGSADSNGVPGITLATAGTGNPIRGVIVGLGTREGLMADPNNLNTTVAPATKTQNYYALVVDDPAVIFEVQEVGTGTALTAAEVGLNANLSSGANNGYASGWQVDNSGEGVGSTLQVRLLGLVRRQDNAFGQYAKWLVKINNHELAAGTAGI